MLNWGGFHGHHRVDFDREATLISGGSGTGKSTLLDAYIALMMPSTVPFNGASNDATVGRARGADQRNVLTYLRGKRDTVRDVERVLRGDGTSAWGAISMTFVDGSGRRYTALRTYFAPAGAQRSTEVRTRQLTVEGDFHLPDLADFANGRFDPRALRARFTGLRSYETTQDFLSAVAARLGIGEGGNSDNALRLLSRIQAGHQVRTVDRLYKEMVLEEPPTYAAADAVLAQFQALKQSHESLATDEAKERMLAEIAHLHDDYESARDRVARLDRYGLTRGDDATPFRLWCLTTEYRLLGEAEEANRPRATPRRRRSRWPSRPRPRSRSRSRRSRSSGRRTAATCSPGSTRGSRRRGPERPGSPTPGAPCRSACARSARSSPPRARCAPCRMPQRRSSRASTTTRRAQAPSRRGGPRDRRPDPPPARRRRRARIARGARQPHPRRLRPHPGARSPAHAGSSHPTCPSPPSSWTCTPTTSRGARLPRSPCRASA
ncbi:ATP-binding protein [Microbacterium barkeri]|uniref:ATP-binding protein n=1 Tax=Microbacterium barkeri TaxID=33917 RepID=UPI003612B594